MSEEAAPAEGQGGGGMLTDWMDAQAQKSKAAEQKRADEEEARRKEAELRTAADAVSRAKGQTANPQAQRKLDLANARLAEVKKKRAVFNQAHPEYGPKAKEAPKTPTWKYAAAFFGAAAIGTAIWWKWGRK